MKQQVTFLRAIIRQHWHAVCGIACVALALHVHAGDCIHGSCGCDSGYTGILTTTWPVSPTTNEPGLMFDLADDGRVTYFNFNGRDYTVPDYAVSEAFTNDTACTFHIVYSGDPVARDGFE